MPAPRSSATTHGESTRELLLYYRPENDTTALLQAVDSSAFRFLDLGEHVGTKATLSYHPPAVASNEAVTSTDDAVLCSNDVHHLRCCATMDSHDSGACKPV
jgi:hypothetical protein